MNKAEYIAIQDWKEQYEAMFQSASKRQRNNIRAIRMMVSRAKLLIAIYGKPTDNY